MKWLDITREMTAAPLFPGDPAAELLPLSRIALGDECNLSEWRSCLHTGTHIDAPLHYIEEGADITQVDMSACMGECSVIALSGAVVGAQLEDKLPFLKPRVLIKGEDVTLTQSAAFVLADAGVQLVGVEGCSVATADVAAVHRQLLTSGVLILEGLDLSVVAEGTYMLLAAPLKIAGADGAPVRAVLLERQPTLDV